MKSQPPGSVRTVLSSGWTCHLAEGGAAVESVFISRDGDPLVQLVSDWQRGELTVEEAVRSAWVMGEQPSLPPDVLLRLTKADIASSEKPRFHFDRARIYHAYARRAFETGAGDRYLHPWLKSARMLIRFAHEQLLNVGDGFVYNLAVN